MKINEIISESPTMVFPLQQKMELLKKVAGEDSIFSDQQDDEEQYPDEDGEFQDQQMSRAMDKKAGMRMRNALATDDTPSAE